MSLALRLRPLALFVACLLAGAARADSAVGNDTVLGNAFNAGVPGGPLAIDPEWPVGKRTPSGFLLDAPWAIPEERRRTQSGWSYRAWLELGALGGDADERSALYRLYKDVARGWSANSFGMLADDGQARFLEAWGGGAGRDDQFHSLSAGRYNDWKLRAFYNETPHAFTSRYRSLWTGVGTGQLALADARLKPGGGGAGAAQVSAAIDAVLSATPESTLQVIRREGGARLDLRLSEAWKAFASFTSERRQGARPFGAVWGGGGGANNAEIPEAIDYTTHEFAGGLQYADALSALNLQAGASLFRNRIDTLTFESPMAAAPGAGITGLAAGAFTTGRVDLAPGNDYYSARAEYARALPAFWNARLTATGAFASARQDDALIPSMTLPGLVANGVAGGQWNTTASLSQASANARLDTRLVDLGLSAQPLAGLDVRGKLRHYETDNAANYFACNPLTGQVGRVINDGSATSLVAAAAGTPAYPVGGAYCTLETLLAQAAASRLVPAAGNVPIRSVPWDYTQTQSSLSADYRLGRAGTVSATLERERFERTNRERERTTEDKVKLAYVLRNLAAGTLRLSYEADRRRGSEYTSDPTVAFTSASLGALPASGSVTSWIPVLANLRKFDLADRDQGIANARFVLALVPNVDAALSAQLKDVRYPDSDFGRTDARRQRSATLDVNWQPDTQLSAYGFYGWQSARMSQAAIWPATCAIGAAGVTAANFGTLCANAGGPLFPLERAWTASSRDRNDTWGLGFRYDFQPALLEASWLRTTGTSRIDYRYDPAGLANSITPLQQALAGNGFPALESAQSTFEANLVVPVSATLSVRVLLRHERGSVRDWHYDGLAAAPTAGNAAYLDAGPQDYKASVIGVFLRLAL